MASAGSVQYVIICQPYLPSSGNPNNNYSIAPCSRIGTTSYVPAMMKALVLDPDYQSQFDAAVAPFDYYAAASLFATSMSFVVGCFLVARKFGVILEFIRKG